MTGIVRDLGRALRAERLKLKGTLAFWLALIAPTVVVALHFAGVAMRRDYYLARGSFDAWDEFCIQVMIIWVLLMMPLFVTLETALIGQLEHRARGWKQLLALPVSRGATYAAKQVSGMAVIAISLAVLVVLTVLAGWALQFVVPGLGFEDLIPLADVVSFVGYAYLASWLVISIQTWVAQRWPSFVVASGVGIAMTIIGVIVIQSDYAGYYPWTLPALVGNGFNDRIQPLHILEEGVRPVRELVVGSLGGALAAAVGGWDVMRRDVL